MAEEAGETLEGTIKSVVFHNDENGYTVLHVELPSGFALRKLNEITVVGKAQAVWEGEEISATGSWVDADLANFWQTQYTMVDGTDPLRDDKLHMVVPLANCPAGEAGQDYIFEVEFEPSPVNRLEVESIMTVPQGSDIATDVLDELTVTFNKPIDPTTFDRTDILLRYEGEKQTSDVK